MLLVGLLSFGSSTYAAGVPVTLGMAGTYAVLGATTVTNTGASVLVGDLGVSPGTAITGFPPGSVTGTTHAGDAFAAQTHSDLVSAYLEAEGLAPTAGVAGDLIGQTLTAGVYKTASSIGLSGTLTLDGGTDLDAVFVFQIGSTLTTAAQSNISLINGAQACHVFWQVGSSATLGASSVFKGTMMAMASITVGAGTDIEGRALARDAVVTLDSDTITTPGCLAAPTTTTTMVPLSTTTTTMVPLSTTTTTTRCDRAGGGEPDRHRRRSTSVIRRPDPDRNFRPPLHGGRSVAPPAARPWRTTSRPGRRSPRDEPTFEGMNHRRSGQDVSGA